MGSDRLRIAQLGLGPIGVETVRLLARRPWAEVVGGVEVDPEKLGRSLGELTGVEALQDTPSVESVEELLGRDPDVLIDTAGSRVADAFDRIEPAVRSGVHVISSCEELVFPYLKAPEASRAMDGVARADDAAVVGVGVNPGFVMDLLPIVLTGVCQHVDSVHAHRRVDASTRRGPLQRKIGTGETPRSFRDKWEAGTLGHAGLAESAALVAHAMGWPSDRVGEACDPVTAEEAITTQWVSVERGQVCGIEQRAHVDTFEGVVGLQLLMALDLGESEDRVWIGGEPPIRTRIEGGVPGDAATAAALVNTLPDLVQTTPGLRLPTELPVRHCR